MRRVKCDNVGVRTWREARLRLRQRLGAASEGVVDDWLAGRPFTGANTRQRW